MAIVASISNASLYFGNRNNKQNEKKKKQKKKKKLSQIFRIMRPFVCYVLPLVKLRLLK